MLRCDQNLLKNFEVSILNRARMRWRLRYDLGRLQCLHQGQSLSNWWKSHRNPILKRDCSTCCDTCTSAHRWWRNLSGWQRSTSYIQQTNINRLPCPANSPDLNPIKDLWDELRRRLGPQPRDELFNFLTLDWNATCWLTINISLCATNEGVRCKKTLYPFFAFWDKTFLFYAKRVIIFSKEDQYDESNVFSLYTVKMGNPWKIIDGLKCPQK